MIHKLPDVFAKNRSEETSEDNWAEFVVPPFLNDLGIKTQSKAIVIIGGRGCGKTTLLRYFSHATQFSPKRRSLTSEAFLHIGLYWRADTNFLNAFVGGGQGAEIWRSAFMYWHVTLASNLSAASETSTAILSGNNSSAGWIYWISPPSKISPTLGNNTA